MVKTVIRLNESTYNKEVFEQEGMQVLDLKFAEGGNPPEAKIVEFVSMCSSELAKGRAVAVHCKDGQGRTGTMIALYLLYRFRGTTAKTVIAWLRLCRPGSVVGRQQQFLQEMEAKIHELIGRSLAPTAPISSPP